jgi:hypothetical protein
MKMNIVAFLFKNIKVVFLLENKLLLELLKKGLRGNK